MLEVPMMGIGPLLFGEKRILEEDLEGELC
jgi:hypothetical protein